MQRAIGVALEFDGVNEGLAPEFTLPLPVLLLRQGDHVSFLQVVFSSSFPF